MFSYSYLHQLFQDFYLRNIIQLILKIRIPKNTKYMNWVLLCTLLLYYLMFLIVRLQPHLTISSATYKDAGLYICTASNGIVTVDIPMIILVVGAVPFFNQAPHSFLALPTLSNGYLTLNIEITFKPETANGKFCQQVYLSAMCLKLWSFTQNNCKEKKLKLLLFVKNRNISAITQEIRL